MASRSWWSAFAMFAGCFMDSGLADQDSTPLETSGGGSSGSTEVVETTSSSSSSDDDASTGATLCPPATMCTVVPSGWGGPYVVAHSDVPCPPEAPEMVATVHGDLDPAVDCGCACGDATNTCSGSLYLTPNDPECTNPNQAFAIAVGECATIAAADWAGISTAANSAGGCAPSAPANTPTITWNRDAVLCVHPEPAACDGGVCVPRLEPPFVDVCVERYGAHTCPPEFTVGSTWYDEAIDTRACECTCDTPGDVDCGLVLDVFNDADCSQLYYQSNGASCHHGVSVSDPWSVQWAPLAAGSCAPQQAIAGTLAPSGERTLCCRG